MFYNNFHISVALCKYADDTCQASAVKNDNLREIRCCIRSAFFLLSCLPLLLGKTL